MQQDIKKEVRCRICSRLLSVCYSLPTTDNQKILYNICSCGAVFHDGKLEVGKFNSEYLQNIRKQKYFDERLELWRNIYLPVVEENLYGRESLDIGFGFPECIVEMRNRGWLADGIDLIQNDYITGNFETHNFGNKRYDFIIMNHVFENFESPKEALKKAVGLLKAGGYLFVASPDTSLCIEIGYAKFNWWSACNKTMISLDKMISILYKFGMQERPLFSITNQNQRFLYYNDFHLLMRKEIDA